MATELMMMSVCAEVSSLSDMDKNTGKVGLLSVKQMSLQKLLFCRRNLMGQEHLTFLTGFFFQVPLFIF